MEFNFIILIMVITIPNTNLMVIKQSLANFLKHYYLPHHHHHHQEDQSTTIIYLTIIIIKQFL